MGTAPRHLPLERWHSRVPFSGDFGFGPSGRRQFQMSQGQGGTNYQTGLSKLFIPAPGHDHWTADRPHRKPPGSGLRRPQRSHSIRVIWSLVSSSTRNLVSNSLWGVWASFLSLKMLKALRSVASPSCVEGLACYRSVHLWWLRPFLLRSVRQIPGLKTSSRGKPGGELETFIGAATVSILISHFRFLFTVQVALCPPWLPSCSAPCSNNQANRFQSPRMPL